MGSGMVFDENLVCIGFYAGVVFRQYQPLLLLS